MIASPEIFVEFSRQRGLAPDGRCKAFADAADGTAWAEGVGLLALERVSDARRHGHEVLALVRGSAVNQDGATNGLTAPSGPAQRHVIEHALAAAGLEARDVDAVEAHGTGTALGDPIEAEALLATYGADRRRPLWLGSLKSNIGHAQAAAGVAGIIKMVLAMRRGVLPKTLHVDRPTRHVDWEAGGIELLREAVEWEPGAGPRRAGVSSFGISGTNAHVILEQAPAAAAPAPAAERAPDRDAAAIATSVPLLPFVVSGRGRPALVAQARALAAFVDGDAQLDLGDLAAALALDRARLADRAVVLAGDRDELLGGLRAIGGEVPSPSVVEGVAGRAGATAFAFPGQGSQWLGMGRELIAESPVFARRIADCEEALGPHVDWSLGSILRGDDGAWLGRVDIVQPALFAVMVSLADVWRSLGMTPDLVIGHSQGEIAAACVAGALSLEDAARVVALRGRALARVAGRGAMLSVALGRAAFEETVRDAGGEVSLAAVNGPHLTVASGTREALEALVERCESTGVDTRWIPVDYASHSPQIEDLRDELLEALAPIRPVSAPVALHSTLTGTRIDTAEMDAGYWYRSLRNPVLFEDASRLALEAGVTTFVEASPHPVLRMALEQTVDDAGPSQPVRVVGSLRRDSGGAAALLAAAAAAFAHGAPVDWGAVLPARRTRVRPPAYAFQRRRFWLDGGPAAAGAEQLGQRSAEHPLLRAAVEIPEDGGWVFTGRVSLEAFPWLRDHAVGSTCLLPGAAMLEMAAAAGDRVGLAVVEEMALVAPLALAEGEPVSLRLVLGAADAGRRELALLSRRDADDGAEWVRHASGRLSDRAPAAPPAPAEGSWPPAGAEQLDVTGLYDDLAAAGLDYGPAFAGLTRAWRRGDAWFAEIEPAELPAGDFVLHPAHLDAVLHAALLPGSVDAAAEPGLPFALSGVRLAAAAAGALRVSITVDGGAASLRAIDTRGTTVVELGALRARPFDPAELRAARAPGSLFGVAWQPLAADRPGTEPVVVRVRDAIDLSALEGSPDALRWDAAGAGAVEALELVQAFLAAERLAAARLVVITRGAVAASPGDDADPAAAAVWGLVRSAASEHPGRFALLDLDTDEVAGADLATVIAAGEWQVAVRAGELLAPRLEPLSAEPLGAGAGGAWRVEAGAGGTFDDLHVIENPALLEPPAAGTVHVDVRVAGVNFRDTLIALGMYPGAGSIGGEGAGVVRAIGPGVTRFAPGDRVMGLLAGAFGPRAAADERHLLPVPAGWSFARAASVPVAFLTAYFGLFELGGLRSGERVLVHAGAGGVGMAAVQLARHVGAEVFATASPAKWGAVRALGVAEDHLASSRDVGFADRFGAVGGGVDVVLNSLAGEFVDASLGLLGAGGRFVEMGKTDVRDAGEVAERHGGVRYRAFDLLTEDPDRVAAVGAELERRFDAGALVPLPVAAFGLGQARRALRHVSQARHTGKVVLRVPPALGADRTMLVTGGTGTLGALLARHLVRAHGARQLLLVSRSGLAAEGARQLREELRELGADVTVAAADVGDRGAVEALIAGIPADHPLGAVFHAAGVLDDALVTSLGRERLELVLAAKLAGARHLDELTRDVDLDAFVLFSSIAGTIGSAGQANYAAANAGLDALAAHRRARGLPATSIAWGLWEPGSGMTGHLDERARARTGMVPIGPEDGLSLLDRALAHDEPVAVAAALDRARLRADARAGRLAPVLRSLVGTPTRRAGARGGDFAARWAASPAARRPAIAAELVRTHAAGVLGHDGPAAVDPDRTFKELGFDSLSAVELRNALHGATGLRLPATLVFDHPTPRAVARLLAAELGSGQEDGGPSGLEGAFDQLARALTADEVAPDDRRAVAERLLALAGRLTAEHGPAPEPGADRRFESASAEELVRIIEAGS